jgi:hypothetical protein
MINAKEISQLAQTAAQAASEILLENLISGNRLNPEPEESKAFTMALAFTIAQLELYLKLHLPEDQRGEIRRLLDSFSSTVAENVTAMRKEIDKPPESGIIT